MFYWLYFCDTIKDFEEKSHFNLSGEKPDFKKLSSEYFKVEL